MFLRFNCVLRPRQSLLLVSYDYFVADDINLSPLLTHLRRYKIQMLFLYITNNRLEPSRAET